MSYILAVNLTPQHAEALETLLYADREIHPTIDILYSFYGKEVYLERLKNSRLSSILKDLDIGIGYGVETLLISYPQYALTKCFIDEEKGIFVEAPLIRYKSFSTEPSRFKNLTGQGICTHIPNSEEITLYAVNKDDHREIDESFVYCMQHKDALFITTEPGRLKMAADILSRDYLTEEDLALKVAAVPSNTTINVQLKDKKLVINEIHNPISNKKTTGYRRREQSRADNRRRWDKVQV